MTIEKRQLSEQNDNFIMLPTVDFCFKELMQNKEVRKGILSALLGRNPEELEDTELLPTILQPEYQDEKLGILDVRVLFADGTQTDLEMQVVQFDFWPNRVLFYLGKMYTGQIKRGEPYEKLKKCIHVSILDFLHFPKDDRCFRKITFCDVETGEVYTDLMEIYVLELGKLPTEDRNESGIIRWMRFLSGKCKEDLKKMAEIPRTKGPAIGLEKNVCSKKPERDNAPPSSAAIRILGRRIFHIILYSVAAPSFRKRMRRILGTGI